MLEFSTREFESAMRDIERVSEFNDRELVTSNGRGLLRSVVGNTPRESGTGRAGWWPAWTGLDMAGSPFTRRHLGANKFRKQVRIAEGEFVDNRHVKGQASVEFTNTTHVLRGRRKRKKEGKFYYLHASNARGGSAGWKDRAVEEATFKFQRLYQRLLRRKSA